MTKILITENSTFPLPDISVGRASAFCCSISGIDRTYTSVQIAIGQVSSGGHLPCPCTAVPGGDWKCYVSGAFFLSPGATNYHITAKTDKGDSVYLGGGRLLIVESVLNVESSDLPVMPEEVYVRGANGLYYKVTVELDADGVPYMVVAPEGIEK